MKLCRFLEIKKKLPSNKEDMLESFNIDWVVQSDYYRGGRYRPPYLFGFSGGGMLTQAPLVAWCVEETRRHCSSAQKPSATVPSNSWSFGVLLCNFWIVFDLLWVLFFLHVKYGVWENHNKKRCVCVFVFLFMLLNCKNQKD